MVIAVIAVGMVQVAVDEVVDMIAVGHRFVAATGAMHMIGIVAGAGMIGGAVGGVGRAHLDHVLIDVIAVGMVQVSVVQVVDVIAVPNGGVPAAGAVLVGMVDMFIAAHGSAPSVQMGVGRVLQRKVEQANHVFVGEAVVLMPILTAFEYQPRTGQGL